MVKDLPFATAYLGDMFDLAQTNQPGGMDFPLQLREDLCTHESILYVHRHTKGCIHACCQHTNLHTHAHCILI